jgi:hemerythrin superfamily protein
MKVLETLRTHHLSLDKTIKSLSERAVQRPPDVCFLLVFCNEYLIPHAEAEEATFYAACDDTDLRKQMVDTHKKVKAKLNELRSYFLEGNLQAISSNLGELTALLERHHYDEENDLIPQLSAKLSEQELTSLMDEAQKIESGKRIFDIQSLFEYDHKRISLTISELQIANDNGTLAKLYSKVKDQLLAHADLEESLLHPAFVDHSVSPERNEMLKIVSGEHQEIARYLSVHPDQIGRNAFKVNLENLRGLLAVHRDREEQILLPMINKLLKRKNREAVFNKCFQKLSEV